MAKQIVCRVRRTGDVPYHQEYLVPWEEGMTLLGALRYIHTQIDATLAIPGVFCKRGLCGGCVVLCNAKRTLACRMLLPPGLYLVEPVQDRQVIRDLVVDQSWVEGNRLREEE